MPSAAESSEGDMHRIIQRYLTVSFGFGAAALLHLPALHAGQEPPPVNGTIALEGTVDQTYKAANTVIVKTVDGVRHLFHLTGKTTVHGSESAGANGRRGLKVGTKVVVHYTGDAREQTALEVDRLDAEGLKTMEGVVTHVDRAARKISIRLGDGSVQRFVLTERAAMNVDKDVDQAAHHAMRVVVYYADESGQRVAHYVKRTS
jgi:hypothetical protein